MEQKDISKENTAVMLNSILTTNWNLLVKLKVQFPSFRREQVYTALLLNLGFTFNEIRIILGIMIKDVEKTSALLLTTDLNVTNKRNFLIPPFCVVDLGRDAEGSFLVYSGADSHVRFSP